MQSLIGRFLTGQDEDEALLTCSDESKEDPRLHQGPLANFRVDLALYRNWAF